MVSWRWRLRWSCWATLMRLAGLSREAAAEPREGWQEVRERSAAAEAMVVRMMSFMVFGVGGSLVVVGWCRDRVVCGRGGGGGEVLVKEE